MEVQLVLPRIAQGRFAELARNGSEQCRKRKRTAYECYKPRTMEEVKEYVHFVLDYRSIVCNEVASYLPKSSQAEAAPDISFENPPLGLSQKLTSYLKGVSRQRKDPRNKSLLWFDSNFECGNLERAIAKSDSEYELYVNSDTNALAMHQWFYFSVENTKVRQTIRFHIMNLTKFSRFYAESGMRPSVFSESEYRANVGWTQENIENCELSKALDLDYFPEGRAIPINGYMASNEKKEGEPFYRLSFSYTFKHSNDKVYFAFLSPYSFTRLYRLFSRVETQLFQSSVRANCQKVNSLLEIEIETGTLQYRRVQLCKTAAGVPVDCLAVSGARLKEPAQYIVITARVHAAETPGSYNVEQVIDFLLGSSKIAAALRKQYTFLIVPMLNPDGVILGNTRYSIEGDDLNRCWDNPSAVHHPAIHSLKELLRNLTAEKAEIKVYCDLHGHSKRYDSFIYACHHVLNATHDSWNSTRMLTKIMARTCSSFDYHQCSFEIKPDKVNTARVVIWKEFKVMHSFTLETSIYGYTSNGRIIQFEDKDYLFIGKALMLSLYEYGVILGKLSDAAPPLKFSKTIDEDRKKDCKPVKVEVSLKDKVHKPRSKSNLCKSEVLKNLSGSEGKELKGDREKLAVAGECVGKEDARGNDLPAISASCTPGKAESHWQFEQTQGIRPNVVNFLATQKKNKKIMNNSKVLITLSKRSGFKGKPQSNKQYNQFNSYWKLRSNHKELLSTIYEKSLKTRDRHGAVRQEFPLTITAAVARKMQVCERTQDLALAQPLARRHNKSLEEAQCCTQYSHNCAFLRSTFVLSNDSEAKRGCIRSPKENGFKNFARKMQRANAGLWGSNSGNVEKCRLRLINSLDDPAKPVFFFNLNGVNLRRTTINYNFVSNNEKVASVSPRKGLKSKRLKN